jgi:hypothetical protein
MATAWFYTLLTTTLAMGTAAIGVVGAFIAALWVGAGVYLGRRYDHKETQDQS